LLPICAEHNKLIPEPYKKMFNRGWQLINTVEGTTAVGIGVYVGANSKAAILEIPVTNCGYGGVALSNVFERWKHVIAAADPASASVATANQIARRFTSRPALNGHVGRDFEEHFAKLQAIIEDPSLWPDGAEKPSEAAVDRALAMLDQLAHDQVPPTRVVASAEGGVAICFVRGEKYADVEFLNTGEILGVVSNRRDRPVVWEVDQNSPGLAQASARVRDFIYTPTPAAHDPRRSRSR
jgi:hypothetical protein